MATLKIDQKAFERALQKAAAPAVKGFEKDMNKILANASGRSTASVMSELEQAAKRHGVKPDRQGLRKLIESHRKA